MNKYMIRRYSNRRLYDIQESKYTDFEELLVKVKEGAEIQVFNHVTGGDITGYTLLAMMEYAVRQQGVQVPVQKVVELVRECF